MNEAVTTTATVRRSARRASDSTWLEYLTRAGLVGYGLLHLAIAWLAVQIAANRGARGADQAGAFRLIRHQPLGTALLIVIAVGLAAMAVWQLLLAAFGHRQYQGKRRIFERIASGGRVVAYVFLCWTAVKVLRGSSTSSAATQQRATAGILAHPAGQWLVGTAGVVVAAIGVGMVVYGVTGAFRSKLALGTAGPVVRRTVLGLGGFGYAVRGVAFAVLGGLLVDAAVSDDAARSRGLDGALREIAGQPFGVVWLIVTAVGFAAFGGYCFMQSRYRRI
jgi:hypothetical protein